MNAFPVLHSKQLLLRAFIMADASTVQLLAGDFEIADTTSSIPHPYPDGAAEGWISSHESEFVMGESIHWAIQHTKHGLIGAISLIDINTEFQHAEMGYWIGTPFWGKGYCTEAASSVLQYAFRQMDFCRIYAYHFTRNPASGRVMQKLGMQQEGLLRSHVKRWDKWEDLAVYGILRPDVR